MLIALPFAPQVLFINGVIRERKRKRKRREKEKNREREREREGGREGCFCKRLFFLPVAPGSPPEKFAVIRNLGNKPTKVNRTRSWPIALCICGKTVL
jgi:hypothetical protein